MTFKAKAIIIAVMAVFFAVGISSTAIAQKNKPDMMKLKVATLAPKGVGWSIHFENIILSAVEEATEGNVLTKVYWGGVMGDEDDFIEKMRTGLLHGAGLSGYGSTLLCPQIAVVELPFLFNNYDEVDYIRNKMEATFDGILKKNGYFLFSWADQDFDQIISGNKSITSLEDFENTRFLTWYGPLETNLMKTLKAIPVSMDFPEVAQGVRTGAFESSIGPCVFVVGAQLHNVIRHINPCKIRYSPSLMVITSKIWDTVPDKYIKEYYRIRRSLTWEYNSRVRADNIRTMEALFQYGIIKDEFSPEELVKIKKATRGIWDKMAGKVYSRKVLDEVLGHLKEFRKVYPK